MYRTKTILILAMVIAMAVSSYCPAAEIIHNWRQATTSGSFWTMTNWRNMDDSNDVNSPDMKRLTELDPNSAFFVQVGKSIRMQAEAGTAVTNTPTGDWYITAPFSVVSEVPSSVQTMEPNDAPMVLNGISQGMLISSGVGTNLNDRIYSFSNLKLQGWIGGWRPAGMHLAGKMTLTGPTAFGVARDGGTNSWYLDAEVDASVLNEIGILHFTRENYPNTQGNHINCEKMWFGGKWVLDSRMYADRAGCLGDADIQINGAGTPGLVNVGGVATPWVDRRSGDLWVAAQDAVSRNAKWTIDTTSVEYYPETYGTMTYPTSFTPTNPQCPGGKVRVANAASPVKVRELWVDGVKKANATYYSTDSANSAWFATASGYTGSIQVTGGTTKNLTMKAVLDPGASAEPNLTTYPKVDTTKAFLTGYVVNIKANDPIVTPDGKGYKFLNWTKVGTGVVGNVNAAQTTVFLTSGDTTLTAHYVISANSPSPADTAVDVPVTTDIDWTPGLPTATQDLYFGTNSASLTFIKSFADGSTHGATNAELVAKVGAFPDATTYYWEVKTDGQPGPIWQFRTVQLRPLYPNPVDDANEVERITPKLSWDIGHPSATKWDVYFGTSPASLAMIDPNGGITPAPVFTPDVNAPAGLVINTTYYWRVDEYNDYGAPNTGFVWSFTTRGPLCMGIGKGDINADCRVTFVDFAIVASSLINN